MMGWHLRDRGLAKRIAQHEKRLNELEAAVPHIVKALTQHATVISGMLATPMAPPDRTAAQLAERQRVKALLSAVPPIA